MRALTLWQPMASAIIDGSKRIENRPRRLPESLLYRRILIHAGRKWSDEHARMCAANGFALRPEDAMHGAIIGSAVLVGCVDRVDAVPDGFDPRWWLGPFGWLLDAVRALPSPVACPGLQAIGWTPPADVLDRVERQTFYNDGIEPLMRGAR